MSEQTIVILAAIAAALVIVHLWARWYSKNHYEHFLCAKCKGSGKKWEPIWLMWLCCRFKKRAFTSCVPCGGTGKFAR